MTSKSKSVTLEPKQSIYMTIYVLCNFEMTSSPATPFPLFFFVIIDEFALWGSKLLRNGKFEEINTNVVRKNIRNDHPIMRDELVGVSKSKGGGSGGKMIKKIVMYINC